VGVGGGGGGGGGGPSGVSTPKSIRAIQNKKHPPAFKGTKGIRSKQCAGAELSDIPVQ